MSRTHDRAYRLLAEKMRLGDAWRRSLYALFAFVFGSGAFWLMVHFGVFFPRHEGDELSALAWEALALKLHGASVLMVLVVIGAMTTNHVRRGWGLARNRIGGSLLVACLLALTVTGYALYYLVDTDSRPGVSMLHWVIGLALLPIIFFHIVLGRRSRPVDSPRRSLFGQRESGR
jgi:hypothetical protein